MTVLDASAVLALVQDEPGADVVQHQLPGSVMSAVNLAEVVGKLVDAGRAARQVRPLLLTAGVTIEPFGDDDAELAGALRTLEGGRTLSLGDRCCLALALRDASGSVLTADQAWADLGLPLDVRLLR